VAITFYLAYGSSDCLQYPLAIDHHRHRIHDTFDLELCIDDKEKAN
jgi:signal transduction protein with GAF and PtsI domain